MNGADFVRFVLNGEPYRTVITDFYMHPTTVSGVELDLYYLRQYLVDNRITAKKMAEESGEDITFVRQAIHTQTEKPTQKLLEAIERLVPVEDLVEVSKRSMRRVVTLEPGKEAPPFVTDVKILNEEVREHNE